jgi:hypothetical protein
MRSSFPNQARRDITFILGPRLLIHDLFNNRTEHTRRSSAVGGPTEFNHGLLNERLAVQQLGNSSHRPHPFRFVKHRSADVLASRCRDDRSRIL